MASAEDFVERIDEIYGNGNQRMLYTDEQLRRADIADAMHVAMEHCSDQQLKAFIESPSTINCPITFNDVKNLRAIKGPCLVCMEGKPQPNKGMNSSNDPKVPTTPGERLHVDIVFVKGKPRLFSVDHVSGYCSFIVLDGKNYLDLVKGFEELLNAYQSFLKVVKEVSVDAESVLAACSSYLNSRGVKLCARIPGEHEKYAERAMRVVRERMRVKILELPYKLPRHHHDCLAAEVIRTMNMLPNSRSFPLSPKGLVRGEQTNMQTDLAPPFGSSVLCPVASATHSSEQKTEMGVVMGSSEGTKGGVKVYLLNNRPPVVRRILKPLAMSQLIIEHMNEVANSTKEYKKDDSDDTDGGADMFNYTETLGQDVNPVSDDFYRGEDVGEKLGVPIGGTKTLVPMSYSLTPGDAIAVGRTTVVENQESQPVLPPATPVRMESIYPAVTTPVVPMMLPPSPAPKVNPTKPAREINITKSSLRSQSKSVNYLYEEEGLVFQMSLVKALQSEHSDAAKESAKKELLQLVRLKTWKYLRRAEDATPSVHTRETPCSMFVKPKYNAEGIFTLMKARLVDGGHRTDPERYDPHEKTSPTVSLEVVMCLLAIAMERGWRIEGFDVPGAYLNANLKPGHFHKMRIGKKIASLLQQVDPSCREFVQQDGTLLVEIQKSLYGLPEAAQLWYEYLSGALRNGGYTQCPYDPCLFMRSTSGGSMSIIAIYVDDCLHIYSSEATRNQLYSSLASANLKDLKIEQLTPRIPISFLGLHIVKTGPGAIKVNQRGYLKSVLEEYREDFADFPMNHAATPCGDDIFRPNYTGEDAEPADTTAFLSKLMKIRYLVRTRPDIDLACSGLCTRSRAPQKGDAKALNRLLAYLAMNKDLGITIRATDLQLNAQFDAGFGTHMDRKSHNGHLVFLGTGVYKVPIHWRSSKQKVVATSSTEAELICVFDGLDFLIWIRRVMDFLKCPQKPVTIWQDNTSTITMAFMGRGSSASNTRHIDIKYFFIKQFIEDGSFVIDHMGRENMLGDFFASPRTGQGFRRVRALIMQPEQ